MHFKINILKFQIFKKFKLIFSGKVRFLNCMILVAMNDIHTYNIYTYIYNKYLCIYAYMHIHYYTHTRERERGEVEGGRGEIGREGGGGGERGGGEKEGEREGGREGGRLCKKGRNISEKNKSLIKNISR